MEWTALATRVIFCSLAITACAGKKPYLYGNTSCGEGQTAYVTVGDKAAICLPSYQVAYMMCIRDLSLVEHDSDYSTKTSGKLPISYGGGTIAPEASRELSEGYKAKWAGEGSLSEARGRALDMCGRFVTDSGPRPHGAGTNESKPPAPAGGAADPPAVAPDT